MASDKEGRGASGKLPWGLQSDKLLPGSTKMISESKLKAFNIGAMTAGKKVLSKREQEDLKKKQEEEAVGAVYKEFVETFVDTGKSANKPWVKGGVEGAPPGKSINDKSKGHARHSTHIADHPRHHGDIADSGPRLYKPKSKISEQIATQAALNALKREEEAAKKKLEKPNLKKKAQEKKKSNLELFKEELKVIQLEREQRHGIKSAMGLGPDTRISRFEPLDDEPSSRSMGSSTYGTSEPGGRGIVNYDDDNTTNLYLGNINPKMTETQLCEMFGKYGPLASVKVMWPRSDEERQRGRNCGFVAFMNRKDGERCLAALRGKDVMGFEMKLGWGKAVPIPPHPVYIPPALVQLTLPPPQSGLPFNAQKKGQKLRRDVDPKSVEWDDKTLANAVVKVVIPTERNLLFVIHRMIEFVVREGPMFEAMIMNRELSNPMFRFLFENKSPAHIYYRWKLFSVLQGDNIYSWRLEEFRMFAGGSMWRPPPINPYTSGMPQELVDAAERDELVKGQLNDTQRDRFEDMLRDLTPERSKIGDAMVWCMDHAESAEEIVDCISESLSILQTPVPKKIARLYLVSDILYNSSAKVQNASFFRKYLESKLSEIFENVRATHESIEARLKAEQFKQKVMNCFRAWEDWAIYPNELLIKLQNVFLGLVPQMSRLDDDTNDHSPSGGGIGESRDLDADFDGVPMTDLLEEDLDGTPLGEDIDGTPIEKPKRTKLEPLPSAKFVPSKWETVDEEDLKAQVVTTSKWDLFDTEDNSKSTVGGASDDEDVDGRPMSDDDDDSRSVSMRSRGSSPELDASKQQPLTEQQRAKLREVEVKVMKYQDELEGGGRSRKSGMDIVQQVQKYRQKLMQKIREKEQERDHKRDRGANRKRERSRDRSDRRRDRSSSSDERYPTPVPYHRRLVGDSASNSPHSPPSSRRRNRSPGSNRVLEPDFSPSTAGKRRRSRSPRRKRSLSPYSRDSSRSPVRHKHKHKKKH